MTAPIAQEAQEAQERPSLWRNREFVALWSGQVVSTPGAQISATAMPLFALTPSPLLLGAIGARCAFVGPL
ncbi:hypothetical protein [Streptomyces sp. NPDC002580]|uniref:hypothetical protein n=1 Tax=Streptomyces sp. NPDC002580 TaxID=3364653 RepID=UPI00368B42C0